MLPKMTAGTIETPRLTLRPLSTGDVDLLVDLDGDPEVMRYLTNGVPTAYDEMAAVVLRSLGHRWLGFERAKNEFVDWFGLPQSAPGEYEIGYRLRRAAWGQGFATEGVGALLVVAFTQLGARRVWAQTMAVNARSRRVMERCGMRYVRTFHQHFDDPIPGTEHGEVEYEVRSEDWRVVAPDTRL